MKKNLVYAVAMAGLGTRFTRAGYALPKYMIRAAGATLFEHSLRSLPLEPARKLVFIALKQCFDRHLQWTRKPLKHFQSVDRIPDHLAIDCGSQNSLIVRDHSPTFVKDSTTLWKQPNCSCAHSQNDCLIVLYLNCLQKPHPHRQ